MKQDLVNSALDILRAKENKAKQIANQNKQQAMNDKLFANLYNTYIGNMIECAKGNINQKELDNSKKSLQARLKELEIENIEPKFSCAKCEDTGYANGKICSCLKKEISKILIKKFLI